MATASKAETTNASAPNGIGAFKDEDLNAQLQELKSDIASITDRLSLIGKTGVQKAAYEGEKAKLEGQEKIQDLADDAYLQFLELEKKASTAVRRNPIQTLGIAAGIGFLAAALMRR